MSFTEERPVSGLRENPASLSIYGVEDFASEEGKRFLESVLEKGVLEPLVIKSDGTILSGHRRYAAVRKLLTDGKLEDDTVPCRVVDVVDGLEEKALIIDFNKQRVKTTKQRQREIDALEEVEEQRAKQRQLSGLAAGDQLKLPSSSGELNGAEGSTRSKIAKMEGLSESTLFRERRIWKEAQKGNPKAKELIEKLDSGKLEVGTAYEQLRKEEKVNELRGKVAEIRSAPVPAADGLILGDALDEMRQLGGDSVGLLLTDPPFGVKGEVTQHREGNPKKYNPALLALQKEDLRAFDDLDNEEYLRFMNSWMAEAFRVMRPGAHLVVFVDRLKVSYIADIAESLGFKVRQPLFWLVSNPVPVTGKHDFCDAVTEMLWFTKPGDREHKAVFHYELGLHSNYFEAPYVSGGEKTSHPAQKPVAVLEQLVNYLSDPGETVLDPFMGSGSTVVAARNLGRKGVGIEKDELYFKIASSRLATLQDRATSG